MAPEGVTLDSMFFEPMKIQEKLKGLKNFSAPGPDGLLSNVLKELSYELSFPLSILFNKCLSTGFVPTDWKRANVTPLFKKGSKTEASNYRPVSLTAILCRVMESLMKDNIYGFLHYHKLIRDTQHGFSSNRSTLTNMLSFMEDMTKLMDDGLNVDVLYLDFAKAFDKVPIQRLLSKCRGLGLGGDLLNWISEWLTGRQQRVVLNGEASDWAPVTSGVPQGSVLGPLLFLIFINDIDSVVDLVSTFLYKFADDTKMGAPIRSPLDAEEFQKQIDALCSWASKWQMVYNVSKCHIIHVGKSNPQHEYNMNGAKLEMSTEEKDVGTIVSNDLKPSKHCAQIAKKANGILGLICRGLSYRNKKTFIRIYTVFVRSILETDSPVWSPWNKADIALIESVQKRALRMVSGLKSSNYEDRLKELNMETLEIRREKKDLLQVFKVLKGFDRVDPSKWFDMFEHGSEGINTRNSMGAYNLLKPKAKLEVRRNYWSVRVVDKWN